MLMVGIPPPCMLAEPAMGSQATLQQKEQQQPAQQPSPAPLVAPYSRSYGRTHVARILSAEDGGLSLVPPPTPPDLI